ncbi:hypothetical protein GmRootV15_22930 [Variovorax sp. V15]
MNGPPKDVDLQKPTHPLLNEGGSSNGLADRDILAETGRARALPFEPPKKRHERKSRRPVRWLRLSSQDVGGLLNPAPLITRRGQCKRCGQS